MEREVKSRRPSPQGFSLVELTMAFAIFLVAALAAYALYYSGTRSFKKAENVTSLQQNARVGFDRMVRELRLAGFNHNSDGTTARLDEQIEGAWDTAVTIRGDFDFEDPTLSVTPESTLDGTFNEVAIGNDEIVTYALGKPTLSNNTDISFISDVIEVPRHQRPSCPSRSFTIRSTPRRGARALAWPPRAAGQPRPRAGVLRQTARR